MWSFEAAWLGFKVIIHPEMREVSWKYCCRDTDFRASEQSWIHISLRWRHNGGDSVSNHQPRECLLNRLIRCRSKKTSKLRVAGLCVGNSPRTSEFPAQMASNAENVSIWWRHHVAALNFHGKTSYGLVSRGRNSVRFRFETTFGSSYDIYAFRSDPNVPSQYKDGLARYGA